MDARAQKCSSSLAQGQEKERERDSPGDKYKHTPRGKDAREWRTKKVNAKEAERGTRNWQPNAEVYYTYI